MSGYATPARTCLLLACVLGLPGCSAINGLYFGLEEDVDTLVSHLDAAGDRFLPHGPRPPLEARQADRRHVRFETDPLTRSQGTRPVRRAPHRSATTLQREAPSAPSAAPTPVPPAPARDHPRPPAAWVSAPAPAQPPHHYKLSP